MNGPGLTLIFPRIRVTPFIRWDFVVGEQSYSSKYVSGISGLVRDNNNITVGSHIGVILRPEMNSYYVSGIVLDSCSSARPLCRLDCFSKVFFRETQTTSSLVWCQLSARCSIDKKRAQEILFLPHRKSSPEEATYSLIASRFAPVN